MNTIKLRITFADGRNEERLLALGRHRIGREAGEIVLGDPNVSAQHAEIDVQPARVVITDLGSSNGTFDARGQRLTEPHVLQLHQPTRLGSTTLTVLDGPMRSMAGGTQVLAVTPPLPMEPQTRSSASGEPVGARPQQKAAGVVPGVVVRVPGASPGLLVVDGQQFPFQLENVWMLPRAPAADLAVNVEFDDGGSVVRVTRPTDGEGERRTDDRQSVEARARDAAQLVRRGVRAMASGMGRLPFASWVVLFGAWFFVPAVELGVGFTSWEISSFNPGRGGLVPGRSPYALLGLGAIAAPGLASVLREPWGRWLYAAPLGFLALVTARISSAVLTSDGFVRMALETAVDVMSLRFGAYLIIAAALLLALQVFRAHPATRVAAAQVPDGGEAFARQAREAVGLGLRHSERARAGAQHLAQRAIARAAALSPRQRRVGSLVVAASAVALTGLGLLMGPSATEKAMTRLGAAIEALPATLAENRDDCSAVAAALVEFGTITKEVEKLQQELPKAERLALVKYVDGAKVKTRGKLRQELRRLRSCELDPEFRAAIESARWP